jgi:hypothetical protein
VQTRREFIITSLSALAAIPTAIQACTLPPRPLKAELRLRRLYVRRTSEWGYHLVSDGPGSPRPLIKRTVIERVFGEGTYDALPQRDHWAMIDADWFGGDDLFVPQPVRDPEFNIWQGYYHPMAEAHDLLEDVFFAGGAPWWGAYMPEYSLTLGEHPNTPRSATARVHDIGRLPMLAAAVAERTPHLVIEYSDLLDRSDGEH